jgi:hypothetical protein
MKSYNRIGMEVNDNGIIQFSREVVFCIKVKLRFNSIK